MRHVKLVSFKKHIALSFFCSLLMSGSALAQEVVEIEEEQERLIQIELSEQELRQAELSFYEENEEADFVEGLEVEPEVRGHRLSVLGDLYEQRLLIDAQAELANARTKIQSTDIETAAIKESFAPVVRMVQGVGRNLYATFLYPGGMTVDARVGDVISGGYKVKSINVNQVTLEKNGEVVYLRFSATPSTPNSPSPMGFDQGEFSSMPMF